MMTCLSKKHVSGLLTWGWLILFLHKAMACLPPPAQADSTTNQLYFPFLTIFENLLPEGTEDQNISIFDELEWLTRQPLNLNTATPEELRALPMLNELLITRLHEHIYTNGFLLSMLELQSIEGFYPELIESLMPFAHVGRDEARPVFSPGTLTSEGEQVLFVRFQQLLETQRGFMKNNGNEPTYPGSPYRLYARYRYTWYRHISIGITAEKDPGEELFRGSQAVGFDFYSAHVFIRDIGKLKALALGDFLVQWGQGLTLWSGMGFGKSSNTLGVKKNGSGIRQYTSVDENNFFRGVGMTWLAGPVEVSVFYSPKKRDASILTSDNGQLVIGGFPQTGLHRTPGELEGKNAVRETSLGAKLSGHIGAARIGITAVNTSWDARISKSIQPYNRFTISDNFCLNMGMHYDWSVRNMAVFGEVASGAELHFSFINGILIGLHPRLSMALVHRHYHHKYKAVSTSAFGENAGGANEKGIYMGLEARLSPSLIISAYADHFQFPWLRYRASSPSTGSDYLLHTDYKPNRETNIYLRFRIKSKPLNSKDSNGVVFLDDVQRMQIRVHAGRELSPAFRLNNRIEYVRHANGQLITHGFLVYQDLLYRPSGSPAAITFRYAMFNTDGHDSRIYAHEHDVLYAFSFPFYSDRGIRFYLLTRYNIHKKLDLYARFARTAYTNRDHTGTGSDLVEGNQRNEIKLQLRIRF